ncbi:IS5 family transposase [Oceanidesulfovibrio marinus]|uniref:IS5 family transposase n=1 Tax=Oceanidesulfovibrio marinus TaxID=370038 RepID=UPI002467E655|nr:IS5 family transposase [Oceanidesulfovibrio marinus]
MRSGKKGDAAVGKTKRGKGSKIMAVADASGLPVSVHVVSASPHEVTLVDQTLDAGFTNEVPARLLSDNEYGSDGLDEWLREGWGTEMIAPHRRGRKRTKTQDGRPLRRYRRRWKVERLFAWLQNFRRLAVRYEFHAENFLAFVQLRCIVILVRQF